MGASVAPFLSQTFCHLHLFSFPALSNSGRPTGSEIPIAILLLSHSSEVPGDPERLPGWSKDFDDEVIGGIAIEDYLPASWAPSQIYNKGKGNIHRLVAQGGGWIATVILDQDAPSLVSTIPVQKELAITTT